MIYICIKEIEKGFMNKRKCSKKAGGEKFLTLGNKDNWKKKNYPFKGKIIAF